jgi:hypothetical protein
MPPESFDGALLAEAKVAGDRSELAPPQFLYENANRLELHSIGWRFRFRFTYNSTDSNRVRRQLK